MKILRDNITDANTRRNTLSIYVFSGVGGGGRVLNGAGSVRGVLNGAGSVRGRGTVGAGLCVGEVGQYNRRVAVYW